MTAQTIPAAEAAEVLDEIATYLEFKNENPFKIRAFSNGARILKGKSASLNDLLASGELKETKGIGKGLLEKLQELADYGHSRYLNELRKGTPKGLQQMLRVPGLGPKKVRVLYDELKIKTLEQLAKACQKGKLGDLKGFGEKTAQNILRGIGFIQKHADRIRYDEAFPKAYEIGIIQITVF